ncbi:MAG: hypothetical protein OXN97_21105 [Bryobacterales bacterium]|nr:hypothetical protein [Bryobacterales bacterium]
MPFSPHDVDYNTNLVLALILTRPPGETVPDAIRHYNGNRDEAVERLLLPR